MARMDDDAQQPAGRCGASIHPQEDRQDHVIDLTVKHLGRGRRIQGRVIDPLRADEAVPLRERLYLNRADPKTGPRDRPPDCLS